MWSALLMASGSETRDGGLQADEDERAAEEDQRGGHEWRAGFRATLAEHGDACWGLAHEARVCKQRGGGSFEAAGEVRGGGIGAVGALLVRADLDQHTWAGGARGSDPLAVVAPGQVALATENDQVGEADVVEGSAGVDARRWWPWPRGRRRWLPFWPSVLPRMARSW